MKTLKFTKEKTYDKGYGYITSYNYKEWSISQEIRENGFGGFEQKGGWLIMYKGEMFKGVSGALPTLKLCKSLVEGNIKAKLVW